MQGVCDSRAGRRRRVCCGRGPDTRPPNHADYIRELKHIRRLREEAGARENRHVSTAAVSSAVRAETQTTRRRSVDHRLVRRVRRTGKTPRTPAEIDVTPFIAQNTIYIPQSKSVFVLCRDWGMRVAATVRWMCVDGTFRAAPKTHYQLLTFHAICANGSSFPIIHVLMCDKSFRSYRLVLRKIEERARAMGLGPVFKRKDLVVSVDFESALIKALRNAGAALHGCYFHLCQAVWRFVKTHSMSLRYNTDALFKARIRALTAIVFLPVDDVPRHFQSMKSLVADDDQLLRVYEYFETTWLNGFGVKPISQHGEAFRTNNCAEAFHSSLRTIFHAPHPNFYDFVERLSGIMERAENEFNVERVNPKVRVKALTLNAKINQLVDNFHERDVLSLDLPSLLDRIGALIGESYDFES